MRSHRKVSKPNRMISCSSIRIDCFIDVWNHSPDMAANWKPYNHDWCTRHALQNIYFKNCICAFFSSNKTVESFCHFFFIFIFLTFSFFRNTFEQHVLELHILDFLDLDILHPEISNFTTDPLSRVLSIILFLSLSSIHLFLPLVWWNVELNVRSWTRVIFGWWDNG